MNQRQTETQTGYNWRVVKYVQHGVASYECSQRSVECWYVEAMDIIIDIVIGQSRVQRRQSIAGCKGLTTFPKQLSQVCRNIFTICSH